MIKHTDFIRRITQNDINKIEYQQQTQEYAKLLNDVTRAAFAEIDLSDGNILSNNMKQQIRKNYELIGARVVSDILNQETLSDAAKVFLFWLDVATAAEKSDEVNYEVQSAISAALCSKFIDKIFSGRFENIPAKPGYTLLNKKAQHNLKLLKDQHRYPLELTTQTQVFPPSAKYMNALENASDSNLKIKYYQILKSMTHFQKETSIKKESVILAQNELLSDIRINGILEKRDRTEKNEAYIEQNKKRIIEENKEYITLEHKEVIIETPPNINSEDSLYELADSRAKKILNKQIPNNQSLNSAILPDTQTIHSIKLSKTKADPIQALKNEARSIFQLSFAFRKAIDPQERIECLDNLKKSLISFFNSDLFPVLMKKKEKKHADKTLQEKFIERAGLPSDIIKLFPEYVKIKKVEQQEAAEVAAKTAAKEICNYLNETIKPPEQEGQASSSTSASSLPTTSAFSNISEPPSFFSTDPTTSFESFLLSSSSSITPHRLSSSSNSEIIPIQPFSPPAISEQEVRSPTAELGID